MKENTYEKFLIKKITDLDLINKDITNMLSYFKKELDKLRSEENGNI